MHADYDIFEVLPNGSKVRISTVPNLKLALSRLERLAKLTRDECFVTDAKTQQIVAQRNLPAAK